MSFLPEIPSEPQHPTTWGPHPRKKMMMGPITILGGGLLVFFLVIAIVVLLPTTTFDPPPSENWRPLTEQEKAGRQIFLANGCIYCHSGFTRPQDVFASQYYVYPRASLPGDFTGPEDTPNLFGTQRTGPDLSQSGGFHPDDWHWAHYNNPRYTTPFSIMPRFNFLTTDELQKLVAFTQAQGGKLADMRTLHQKNNKWIELAGFNVAAPGEKGDSSDGYPSAVDIKDLMTIERSYWFSDNPMPVTTQNLMRGRQVFQERCVGCHGSSGNGNGPGSFYLLPGVAGFTDATVQQTGSSQSPGAYYWRILRGLPGSAMENFGTRLSVDDIWKVTLFVKTIPNGGLTAEVPTPDMYIRWQGYPGLFQWAECFWPEEQYLTGPDPFAGAPEGIGDMPAFAANGAVNPMYATGLWMLENNARPCGSQGFQNVTLNTITSTVQTRIDGWARQGVDQTQFIPAQMLPPDQQPDSVLPNWDKVNPYTGPGGGNE